MLSTSLSFSKW